MLKRIAVCVVLSFCLAASSSLDAQTRRRAMVPPTTPLVFQGGISNQGCGSQFFVALFPAIPANTIVEEYIDGKLTFRSAVNIPGEQFFHGNVWKPPVPTNCVAQSYGIIVTTGGRQYKLTALTAGLPQDVQPVETVVDSAGGVWFVGEFPKPLTVIALQWLASPVVLQGGNYIPPGAVGHGSTQLLICPARNGNLADLYCSPPKVVVIP